MTARARTRTAPRQLHLYVGDGTRDHRGEGRCWCTLPRRNAIHIEPDRLPDTRDSMDEHRRRAGDRDDEDREAAPLNIRNTATPYRRD